MMKSNWITYFEKSGLIGSPRYEESMAYFRQFENTTPYAKMFSIGLSPQGRSIECLVISSKKEFTPQKAKRSGKAVVLIQNGIHSGEIEGKDSSMLLLRDILMTKEKFHLLDHVILLVIPILNVDGHERISKFNRPNQNGPEEMGWRTNSLNLNLNRDYMKADTPEVRAFLSLFNTWLPDFFIDNHTTNGADYQYNITYALEKCGNIDAGLSKWGTKQFLPSILKEVEEKGFLTAPYIEMRKERLEDGIIDPPASPRLSTGYTAVQNRLGLLVETHSLKPFENRVRSTFAMNVAALEFLNKHSKSIKLLNKKADAASSKIKTLPVKFELTENYKSFFFKGYESFDEESPITGAGVVRYTKTKTEFELPFFDDVQEVKTIQVPKAYIIPKEFVHFISILKIHGIEVNQLPQQKEITVEQYEFWESKFWNRPYEGRYCVDVKCRVIKTRKQFPKGTFFVPTDQRTRRVIVNLLEPEAPDSFVSWGFFNAYFERKEYAEAYVMEPIAQKMLESDESLQQEFQMSLEDQVFRNDPHARLEFFYWRSPYFDTNEKKYPIYRMV